MGSTRVASGSSVPAWPALRASNSRRAAPTACVDVMPAGLSSTSQPWMALPFLRRAIEDLRVRGNEHRRMQREHPTLVPERVGEGARAVVAVQPLRLKTAYRNSGRSSSPTLPPGNPLQRLCRSILVQVASYLRARQQPVNAVGFLKGFVGKEADVGGKFEID